MDFSKYYNKIANCSSDENGRYHGGVSGDQTGREWIIRDWYNRPWNCVLRYPDKEIREMLAEMAIKGANNNNVGYNQWQRDSYYTQLQKVNYDPAKITAKCQTDCSASIIAHVKAIGYLKNIDKFKNISATYTGNMRSAFKAAGFQVLTDSKYLTGTSYLLPGDILLNDAHHVTTFLGIGSKTTEYKTISTPSTTASKPATSSSSSSSKKVGKNVTSTSTKEIQKMLNKVGNYKLTEDNSYGPATTAAVIDFQTRYKLQVDGDVGNQTLSKLKSLYNEATTSQPKAVPTFNGKTYSKTVARTGQVTASKLNVRLGPGTSYKNLTSYPVINRGIKVGVCVQQKVNGSTWYYIRLTGNKGEKYGFVSANYIKLI